MFVLCDCCKRRFHQRQYIIHVDHSPPLVVIIFNSGILTPVVPRLSDRYCGVGRYAAECGLCRSCSHHPGNATIVTAICLVRGCGLSLLQVNLVKTPSIVANDIQHLRYPILICIHLLALTDRE